MNLSHASDSVREMESTHKQLDWRCENMRAVLNKAIGTLKENIKESFDGQNYTNNCIREDIGDCQNGWDKFNSDVDSNPSYALIVRLPGYFERRDHSARQGERSFVTL